MKFTVMHDLYGSGTPQMKKYGMRNSRIRTFVDPKVARAQRIITLLAKSAIAKSGERPPAFGTPLIVAITILYAAPKSLRKGKDNGKGIEGSPCTSHACGDCDNKAKLVIDALTHAGCWADDKDITTLAVTKRWTLGTPRIDVEIEPDVNIEDLGEPDDGDDADIDMDAELKEIEKNQPTD